MPASETPKIRQTNGGGNRICVEHEPTTCNAPRRCQEPTFAGCKTNRRSQARTAYTSQDFGSSLVTYRSVGDETRPKILRRVCGARLRPTVCFTPRKSWLLAPSWSIASRRLVLNANPVPTTVCLANLWSLRCRHSSCISKSRLEPPSLTGHMRVCERGDVGYTSHDPTCHELD